MPRFIYVLLFSVLGATGAMACNSNLYVCDNPTYQQVWDRAASVNTITGTRRSLGTDWATTHQDLMNGQRDGDADWSCVSKMVRSSIGNYNAALCMPVWMRRVPSDGTISFEYQQDVTEAQPLRRALYVVTAASVRQYRHLRPRPPRRFGPHNCPFQIQSIRDSVCH